MPHTTAFARNQWYVAAYGQRGRPRAARPHGLRRAARASTAPEDGDGRRARRPLRAPPLPALREPARTATASSAATTASPTTRPAPASYVPGQQRIPRTARVTAYPVVEQDSLRLGVDRRPGPGRRRRRSRARPGSPTPRLDDRPRHGAARRATTGCSSTTSSTSPTRRTCTAATSARPRSPRRRSPPRSTRSAGIVRVSRHMDDAECPPFYARSTGIEGRITRWQDIEYHAAVPVPAAQPHRAGRRPARGRRQRPERLPRRDHLRDHAVRPTARSTTSGRSRGTSRRTTRRSPSSCGTTTTRWSCRTSTRSTSFSGRSVRSAPATRS